jgi:hypothetical protein
MKLKKPAILLAFIFIFIFFIRPLEGDGDFYHHISLGKYIVTHHQIPQTDPFTYTALNKPFVGYAWGSGVLFYLIFQNFGKYGIILFTALLAGFTLGLLYLYLKQIKVRTGEALAFTLISVPVLATRFPHRPEIFTYPLILLILIIDQLRRHQSKFVWFFPCLILLWANLYGSSVFLGLILLVMIVFRQILADQNKIKSKSTSFYLSVLLAILVSLINGYSFKSLFYLWYIRDIAPTQMEWFGLLHIFKAAPYSYLLTFQYRALVFILFFLLAGVIIVSRLKHLRPNLFHVILATSLVIPFLAFRHVPTAVFLSVPLLAFLSSGLVGKSRKQFLTSLFIFTAFTGLIIIWIDPPRLTNPDHYPASLYQFLHDNQLKGNVLLNPQDGGYISYHFSSYLYISSDTRDDLFLGSTVIQDYFQSIATNKMAELVQKYHPDIILGNLSDGSAYQKVFYSKTWKIVYLQGPFFIAVTSDVARNYQLTTLDFADPFSSHQAKNDSLESAAIYYSQHLETPDDRIRYAYSLFGLKRYQEAITAIKSIRAPSGINNVLFNMNKEFLLSMSYIGSGQCPLAKQSLDQVNQGFKSLIFFPTSKTLPSPFREGYLQYHRYCSLPGLSL